MPACCLDRVRDGLLAVRFRQDRLRENVPLPTDPSRDIALVAYANEPFDARTSAISVVEGESFPDSDLKFLQPVGSPIIVQCEKDHILLWKQQAEKASFVERVAACKITSFFQEHLEELAPDAIYRAKVWGRMDTSWQSDFVDIGLLSVVERDSGERLQRLLERAVTTTKSALGWGKDIRDEDGKWLLKSIFWLLAVKILQDKEVPGFKRLNLCDLETVYLRLAKHYNRDNPRPVQIKGARRREALLAAAEVIGNFGHCGAVTTESLAWVYESAVIDRATRQRLGTHSTPTWLVDDIVSTLRPWIEAMPVDDRRVCEPACGHAGFLIAAMRLLSELLPEDRAQERKAYLRKQLHGIEVDSFAYEVAKLSLTLADVPNDNGWMLEPADIFKGNTLSSAVARANIVLANPPFEPFGDRRPGGAMHSQADETFRQIIHSLPIGGVFGIVMPQTVLKSTQARELRRQLLSDYEISEITLFADKVFNYGEPETAVLIGRRVGPGSQKVPVRYRRVREDQIANYATTLQPSSQEHCQLSDFEERDESLFIPELADIWKKMENLPKLEDFVDGGQGFQHKGKTDKTLPPEAIRESAVEVEGLGLAEGFAGWSQDQLTHELPKTVWLNLDPSVIRARGVKKHGTVIGKKQILLNYARVSRGPWRLKALVDLKGRPVTSRFLVYRARKRGLNLSVLWAILNSPIGNAYAYSQSSKRDVLSGTLLKLPVFLLHEIDTSKLESAVEAYFKAAKGKLPPPKTQKAKKRVTAANQTSLDLPEAEEAQTTCEEELKHLHWRIDAEVLRLYNLPAPDERRILDQFKGKDRLGVPFTQTDYFPAGFTHLHRLSELLAITADWTQTNRRRCHLIRKDVKSKLSEKEKTELMGLEALADARIALMDLQHPEGPNEIQLTVERLKREGKWPE